MLKAAHTAYQLVGVAVEYNKHFAAGARDLIVFLRILPIRKTRDASTNVVL
jgi:hypothetical protein